MPDVQQHPHCGGMSITARLDGLRSILGYVLGLDSVTARIVSGRGLPALRGAPLACPFHYPVATVAVDR